MRCNNILYSNGDPFSRLAVRSGLLLMSRVVTSGSLGLSRTQYPQDAKVTFPMYDHILS